MKLLNWLKQSYFFTLVFLSLLIIISGSIYRLFHLDAKLAVFCFVFALILAFIIFFLAKKNNYSFLLSQNPPAASPSPRSLGLIALYLTLAGLLVFFYFSKQSELAFVSPWELLGAPALILYFLSTLTLVLYLSFYNDFGALLLTIHYVLSFCAGVALFKFGFGYDVFIHEAALREISQNGQILPKTNYYLGYYGLITVISKVFGVSFSVLNRFLVPVLSGLLLPFFLRCGLERIFEKKSLANLVILGLLFFGYPIFIFSTPQNLAFLFLFLGVVSALSAKKSWDLLLMLLLCTAAFLIHPIAGIPALTIAGFKLLSLRDFVNKRIFLRIFFLASACALPLAFLYANSELKNSASGSPGYFRQILSQFLPSVPGQENVLFNALYLFINNLYLIIVLFFAYGLTIYIRNRNRCQNFKIFLWSGLALLLSFLLVSNLNFNGLIAYEQSDYANRVLVMLVLTLSPFLFLAVYHFLDRLKHTEAAFKLSAMLLLALFLTAAYYASYPRKDNYFGSHLYSLSRYDLEAVRFIEKDAGGEEYIVLANQQVSAAALKEFGFKKYYYPNNEAMFYYPIPTGGRLYEYFLKMVYEYPSRYTAEQVKNLVGVERVYFVLNKYWWASPKLFEEAKNESAEHKIFGENDVSVFRY